MLLQSKQANFALACKQHIAGGAGIMVGAGLPLDPLQN